jgi:tetratricopeptide (TPR) repeat protein
MTKRPPLISITRVALLVVLLLQVSGCMSKDERARSFYERGLRFISEHDTAKAAIELRNAVKLKRDFIDGWKALAGIDEAKKDWPRLVSDLRTINELAPDDISVRLKLGKLLLSTDSPHEALTLINAGLSRYDQNADLRALKAAIALKLDDRSVAVREAQAALALDPANADALMTLAIDRLGSGDAKGALALLQSATDTKTLEENVGFQLLKVQLLSQAGDLTSAEKTLKLLIEQNPQEPGYRSLLVNFYIQQHRIEDAEQQMRRLVAANPTDSTAELELVRFLFRVKGAPAEAQKELDDRIKAGGDIFQFGMASAELKVEQGNSASAKEIIEQLIRSANTSDRIQTARIALARIYLSERNLDLAAKMTETVLRDDSHNASALAVRAALRLERSQPNAAIPDLVDALTRQPRAIGLMTLLATAYERSGLIELADKQFADATRVSGFDPNVGLEYASFLERRGSMARAEEILVELIKRQPSNIRILSALAQLRLARQNWSGARTVAESIRRAGNTPTADQLFGEISIGEGKYNEAIEFLQKAYQAAPNAASLKSLISAYMDADRKDEAVSLLRSLVEKENVDALILLGSIEFANGEVDRAIGNFWAAIKSQPKQDAAYRALADVYRRQENVDEAIKIIRQGIQENTNSIVLRTALANTFEQKGDYESAIQQYEFILKKQPGDLIASNNLVNLLLDHRTDDTSRQRAQSMAEILRKSQVPQFKDTLGWAKYRQGDYPAAVSLGEDAAAVLTDQASVRYHLGMEYAAVNQLDKASQQLKKALELAPEGPLAQEIRMAFNKLRPQANRSGPPG